MYEIEKGVLLPKRKGGHGRPKYPWLQMKVGDSFLVPNRTAQFMASQASNWGKKLKAKFTTRDVVGGTRIWRVK